MATAKRNPSRRMTLRTAARKNRRVETGRQWRSYRRRCCLGQLIQISELFSGRFAMRLAHQFWGTPVSSHFLQSSSRPRCSARPFLRRHPRSHGKRRFCGECAIRARTQGPQPNRSARPGESQRSFATPSTASQTRIASSPRRRPRTASRRPSTSSARSKRWRRTGNATNAFPLFASNAMKFPSASPVNTSPPAVDSTPDHVGETCFHSHTIFPVTGSIARNAPQNGWAPSFGKYAEP